MSSPTFLGDYEKGNVTVIVLLINNLASYDLNLTRPRGPNFGASAEAEPISPPTAFIITAVV
jgi:hypothetical protein